MVDWISSNLFQDPTEKQLQQQSDQLVKLQQQGEEQKKQLEAKLQQLSEVKLSSIVQSTAQARQIGNELRLLSLLFF